MRDKAIGYVRVSTQEQVASGGGLGIQRKAIEDYARDNTLRLTAILSDEGESGTNGLDTRRGLASALALLEDGEAKTLVVYRLDRLARDLGLQEVTLSRLQKAGCQVRSVTEADIDTDDPTRVLVRQLLGAVAQYEGALIRGRMASGREAKRARGGWLGGAVPYGYRAEGAELIPDLFEQEGRSRARELREQGLSLREIGRRLYESGYLPKRGTLSPVLIGTPSWSAKAVSSLL